MRSPMLQTFGSLLDAFRQSRNRKRVGRQFRDQGFTEIPAPPIHELLPLRYPQLIRDRSVCLFEKADTQIVLFSTAFTPRTRMPHHSNLFVLLSIQIGQDPELRGISAALREPAEIVSIVDLLDLDSYPSLSPLPDCTIFAADESSARRILDIIEQHRSIQSKGSLVVHAGRLMFQMPSKS